MLNRVVSVRADDFWLTCAKRLGEQAGRSKADFIRDLVFLMVCDEKLGKAITQRLKSEPGISYSL